MPIARPSQHHMERRPPLRVKTGHCETDVDRRDYRDRERVHGHCVQSRRRLAVGRGRWCPMSNTVGAMTTPMKRDRERLRRITLRRTWSVERSRAQAARAARDTSTEWHHLERAHILSQPMAGPHVATHLAMLRAAW